jgi:hypothetical protein
MPQESVDMTALARMVNATESTSAMPDQQLVPVQVQWRATAARHADLWTNAMASRTDERSPT